MAGKNGGSKSYSKKIETGCVASVDGGWEDEHAVEPHNKNSRSLL